MINKEDTGIKIFTSKDLMYSMGLQIGDYICMKNINEHHTIADYVIEEINGEIYYSRGPKAFSLFNLIGKKFAIIARPKRVGDLKCKDFECEACPLRSVCSRDVKTVDFFVRKTWVDVEAAISIARVVPFWKGDRYRELMPSAELIRDYKDGLINEEQYTIRYKQEVLSKLDPKLVGLLLEGRILLCYEKTGSFCHRHIVAEWLREAGFEVKELKGDERL